MTRLDHLVNLVSEFILARNRLMRIHSRLKDQELTEITDNISRLTEELSDEVMMMRMLPLSTVFNLFPRWIRDEAQKLEKDVQLIVEGGDIEIDRSIIDDLKDPILHLLRNALDHGIEPRSSGKVGIIKLSAQREKDFIKIIVDDNGKGIDLDEIRRIALKSNLLKSSTIEKMSNHEILQIIFHPSFSTKKEVTGLSGRGIGLDIVKKAVEGMRGEIEIETAKGIGTKFILTLPLRMATIKVMIFSLEKELYCLPLASIIETFNLSENEIKKVHHHEMVIFRNENLPVVYLKKLLGIPTNGQNRYAAIVAMIGSEKKVILVDNILAQEEMIVKPLDPMVKSRLFSGVSIYSDGRPSLILEPKGLE